MIKKTIVCDCCKKELISEKIIHHGDSHSIEPFAMMFQETANDAILFDSLDFDSITNGKHIIHVCKKCLRKIGGQQ